MCGITGFYGDFPPERIYAINASVAHRGPDDEGFFTDAAARVTLGHRRLSIIDLSSEGRQPMTNEDGALNIVFNGEIYNFRELRAELIAKGHKFRSRTDTETIIHLYEEEGAECVRRLNGIFALAVWDTAKRELFVARDHLGVKPLYYAALPQGFIFASELKALLPFPELPRELDHQTLHQHLSFVWSPAPGTMFRAVKKLEPGFSLLIRDGQIVRHESFYDVPYDGTRLAGSTAEHEQQLRALLSQAVDRQLVADVPVGAFLSGGVDSSALVALMAARQKGERVRCYTIGFAGDERTDENPADLQYARLVAKKFDADLCEVNVAPDIAEFTERMVYQLDEPQADPACLNVSLICEQARADGYKVLLSGAGADDIFSGYRRHLALRLEKYWGWLPQGARRALQAGVKDFKVGNALQRRAQKYFTYAPLSKDDRLLSYFLWATEDTRRNLYSDELRRKLAGYDTLAPLRKTLARIASHEPDALNRMLYLETKHFLPDHNLNYTDKMSMAHGVEVRVPYLDLDLVKFAAQLPPNEKLQGRRVKAIFKDALRPILPTEILTRPKTGFGAPLRRWITEDLRPMVRDVLSADALKRRGLFDPSAVQALIERNERREIDASYLIFSLICTEMWLRNFVDAR